MYDMIVVGAGPAGLTAAVYALRANKTVLVLEKASFGGQITHSPKIENFPGTVRISGTELADRMVEHAISQGADLELGEVTEVSRDEEGFTVTTEDGSYRGKTVVAAVGVRHRTLPLACADEALWESVSYCAVCDGAFYKDKEVVVVGGGNSALQEALMLSELCKKVTVVQNLPYLTGEARLIELVNANPTITVITGTVATGLLGNGTLERVAVKEEATGKEDSIPADGLFIAVGLVPDNDRYASLAELNEW
ncbi:MAG: FAD-binding protein, partial [Ruminococcaceae bacterium]|nr:FAD-binding protein [Oscillospiraceae bacterium]